MNQYTTPRYELIRDYQEKCAAMEEDMLGWKERAETAEAEVREARLRHDAAEDRAEIARLRKWVNDLQSGMFINCVYCGHRYGSYDEVPVSRADVLKEHIQVCPEHPMSALRGQNARLLDSLKRFVSLCGSSLSDEYNQLLVDAKSALENSPSTFSFDPADELEALQNNSQFGVGA